MNLKSKSKLQVKTVSESFRMSIREGFAVQSLIFLFPPLFFSPQTESKLKREIEQRRNQQLQLQGPDTTK